MNKSSKRLTDKTLPFIAAAALLCSCQAKGGEPKPLTSTTVGQTSAVTVTTTAPPVTTTPATTTTSESQPQGVYNNLTGLYDLSDAAAGKRPVAVMVNNLSAALPQYGIYDADIIFECPVEGGITRLMAVYADMTSMPDICSIRSCRYYYVLFAMGLDAVYLHYGLDKTVAQDTLNKFAADHIDGGYGSNAFYRDESRVGSYSREHTIAIKGKNVLQAIKAAGFETDYTDGEQGAQDAVFTFNETVQDISQSECKRIVINFSNYYYSTFRYDEKAKVYKKFHNGQKHMDSAANKQLAFTNVFYLKTTTEIINYDNGLISLDWHGGDGYYLSQGQIMPIKWSKQSETAPLVFTDTDGNILKVNPGKSYIGFADQRFKAEF